LLCALAAEYPALQWLVLPVNDLAGGYDYPAAVRFEIAEQDLPAYAMSDSATSFATVSLDELLAAME
jgi:hypothetical protein